MEKYNKTDHLNQNILEPILNYNLTYIFIQDVHFHAVYYYYSKFRVKTHRRSPFLYGNILTSKHPLDVHTNRAILYLLDPLERKRKLLAKQIYVPGIRRGKSTI